MQLGIIGLGRMGANIARRLMRAGHECVVHDMVAASIDAVARDGAVAAKSLDALVKKLKAPRAIWIMVPHELVDAVIAKLAPLLKKGDIVIDGGNSHYADDAIRPTSWERAESTTSMSARAAECGAWRTATA